MSNNRLKSTLCDLMADALQTCPTFCRDLVAANQVTNYGGAAPLNLTANANNAGHWLIQWQGSIGDHPVSTDGAAVAITRSDTDGYSYTILRNVADGEEITVANAGTVIITAGAEADAFITRGRANNAVPAPCLVLAFPTVSLDLDAKNNFDAAATQPLLYLSPSAAGTDDADDLRLASDNADGLFDYLANNEDLLGWAIINAEIESPLAIDPRDSDRGGDILTAISIGLEASP